MSITTPTLSEAAAELVVVGFGQEALEALVAADVNDQLADVVELNDQNAQFIADLRMPEGATVAQFVELVETNLVKVGANQSGDGLPMELLDTAGPVGGTDVAGLVSDVASNAAALDIAAKSGTADDKAPEDVLDEELDQGTDLQGENNPPADDEAEEPGELAVPEWVSKLDTTGQVFKATFDRYAEDMAPRRPQTTTTLVRAQKTLLRTLIGVINSTSGDNFHSLFNYVLQRFNKERTGVFSERALLRGIDKHQFNPDEINLFPRLINLFVLLGDPQSRQLALRQVSLQKTLATPLITEEGRRRVNQFFGQ